MELIQAPTLAELIKRHGKLPEQRVTSIATQMLDVLDAAHALGVVHRAVKPSNILIASGDVVKLAGFGIAHGHEDTRLTRAGHVIGTQAYMAPELFSGGAITPAADMWSLGATLFHAAEGAGPFDRGSAAATLNAILMEGLPRPACRSPLAEAISALLVREPARRADSGRVRALLRDPAADPRFYQETAFAAGASSAEAGSTGTASPSAADSDAAFGQRLKDAFESKPPEARTTEAAAAEGGGRGGAGEYQRESHVEQVFQSTAVPTDYSSCLEWPALQAWTEGYHQAACLVTGANRVQISGLFTPITPDQ